MTQPSKTKPSRIYFLLAFLLIFPAICISVVVYGFFFGFSFPHCQNNERIVKMPPNLEGATVQLLRNDMSFFANNYPNCVSLTHQAKGILTPYIPTYSRDNVLIKEPTIKVQEYRLRNLLDITCNGIGCYEVGDPGLHLLLEDTQGNTWLLPSYALTTLVDTPATEAGKIVSQKEPNFIYWKDGQVKGILSLDGYVDYANLQYENETFFDNFRRLLKFLTEPG